MSGIKSATPNLGYRPVVRAVIARVGARGRRAPGPEACIRAVGSRAQPLQSLHFPRWDHAPKLNGQSLDPTASDHRFQLGPTHAEPHGRLADHEYRHDRARHDRRRSGRRRRDGRAPLRSTAIVVRPVRIFPLRQSRLASRCLDALPAPGPATPHQGRLPRAPHVATRAIRRPSMRARSDSNGSTGPAFTIAGPASTGGCATERDAFASRAARLR